MKEKFAILDNFLKEDEFTALYANLSMMEYKKVSCPNWSKVYHPLDGESYETEAILSSTLQDESNCALGSLLTKIHHEAVNFPHFSISQDSSFFARGCLHPAGTGLSWHRDGDHTIGSFVFFAHRQWSAWWGGELLISDSPSASGYRNALAQPFAQSTHATFAPEVLDCLLLDKASGTFIIPKPNRLVLMSKDVFHAVRAVTASSGRNFRLSVSGFFLKERVRS